MEGRALSSLHSSSSSPSSSSRLVLGAGGRLTVALLECLPPDPSSSSGSARPPFSAGRFCVLEKTSYVWQRRERDAEALVKEFVRKMESLLLAYARRKNASQTGESHAPRGTASPPRVNVQVGTAEMDTEACHSVPDLRLLFAADSAPTHVRVFLEPAYESSNSSDAPPARSFFSPPLPFTPPAFDSPAAGNQPQASSVIPPVNVVVSEPVASSSSASSSSAASSSLSSSLPRLFVSSTVPRAAESQLPVSDLSPVSMRTPPSPSAGAYGGRDGRESARISPSAGRRKGEGSLGLAVPPGCGVGSQARFRDLMAADKGRLAACTAEGAPRRVSLEELSKHCTREDLWVALDGAVYDISSYVSFHPGGARILVDHAGTDISEVFRRYHAWVNAKHILEYNQVGVFEG